MHEDDYVQQDEMEHMFSFLATANKYTIYFNQVMKAPESNNFSDACIKEVNNHIERKNWRLVPSDEVPEDMKVPSHQDRQGLQHARPDSTSTEGNRNTP